MSPSSANYFSVLNRKNAQFALYFVHSIAEIELRFDLIPKTRSAIAEVALHSTATESKSSRGSCTILQKLQ